MAQLDGEDPRPAPNEGPAPVPTVPAFLLPYGLPAPLARHLALSPAVALFVWAGGLSLLKGSLKKSK